MTAETSRPPSPSGITGQTGTINPAEYNPDLAAAAMAKDLVAKLPVPSVISKKFAVYQGIWAAINHTKDNPTGFDASMRLAVYNAVAEKSVNIDGKYFDAIFAYLMKPKYIIQGMPTGGTTFEEDKPGILSRLWSGLTGKNKEESKS